MIRFSIMPCAKSPEQDICYICGDDGDDHDHVEIFCPYNYLYGRGRYSNTCRGECAPGKHRITSRGSRKFLRRFIRVSNLPPGFREWDLEGYVVFKKRKDVETGEGHQRAQWL
ncbi:unnamed protein product [Urochloa humidicola]